MAIQQIRLPDGSTYNLEEWLHWPTYSVVEGAAGANVNLRAFSYVVGNNVPQAGVISSGARQATEADTNMVAKSRANHDEAFIFFAITDEFFALEGTTDSNSFFPAGPPAVAATAPLLTGTNLRWFQLLMLQEFFVGANISKPMARAPMAYYGQGVGAQGFGPGTPTAVAVGPATALNLNYGTAGLVNPVDNQRRWQMPVMVESDRVMYARLSTPGGALTAVDQDWRIRVILDGVKRRPVA